MNKTESDNAGWLRRMVRRIRQYFDNRKLKEGWVIKKEYHPAYTTRRAMPPSTTKHDQEWIIFMAGTNAVGEPMLRGVSVHKWYFDKVKVGEIITMD